MHKNKFTFNDQSEKNSHGFYVLTDGISTKRFDKNPICLNNHSNSTKDVLGKWVSIKKDGNLLLGVPEFDTEDVDGKETVRKVNKGIIKGCSMGLRSNPKDLKLIDGKLILTKCELMEVSIVAVPSNANTIVLYNEKDEILTEEQIQTLCLSAKQTKTPTNTMKQVTTHLQLAEGATENVILEAVQGIESKLSAATTRADGLQTELDALKATQTAELQASYDTEKALALTDGRLDAASVVLFDESAKTNLSSALDLLKTLPKRTSVKSALDTDGAESSLLKLSWKELDKTGQLTTLKSLDLGAFKEKFKEEYGTEYKE